SRLRECFDVECSLSLLIIVDDGIIEVVQIMIDRSTASNATHLVDPILLYVATVDLGQGVLILAHDDSRFVDPEDKYLAEMPQMFEAILFQGDVVVRLVVFIDDIDHDLWM